MFNCFETSFLGGTVALLLQDHSYYNVTVKICH